MKRFLIFAPAYNESSGGAIVLHRLCHLINEAGRSAHLMPMFSSHEANFLNIGAVTEMVERERQGLLTYPYPTNPYFNTPVFLDNLHSVRDDDEVVVVYPEVVFGNPLAASNVVRWFLHDPGFHTGKVYYAKNELYFRYSPYTADYIVPGSRTAQDYLYVGYFPFEWYNLDNVAAERKGTAYATRGSQKPVTHDLADSVCINGLLHDEVARIFKSVKTFISYDSRTLYSHLAALCGCDSVVIPDEGVDEASWRPEVASRSGIAYGYDKLEQARATAPQVFDYLNEKQQASMASVQKFLREVDATFGS
jgi:hypothetical protein